MIPEHSADTPILRAIRQRRATDTQTASNASETEAEMELVRAWMTERLPPKPDLSVAAPATPLPEGNSGPVPSALAGRLFSKRQYRRAHLKGNHRRLVVDYWRYRQGKASDRTREAIESALADPHSELMARLGHVVPAPPSKTEFFSLERRYRIDRRKGWDRMGYACARLLGRIIPFWNACSTYSRIVQWFQNRTTRRKGAVLPGPLAQPEGPAAQGNDSGRATPDDEE